MPFDDVPQHFAPGCFDEIEHLPGRNAVLGDLVLPDRHLQDRLAEHLLGATRTKLSADVCGVMLAGAAYACFQGHERFDDEEMWARHYTGPDIGGDITLAFRAEDELCRSRRRLGRYMEYLVKRVYPRFASISADADVCDFWFALTHAAPRDRVAAMAAVLHAEEERD